MAPNNTTRQVAPLTPAERADLRQKAEKAAPGPWTLEIADALYGYWTIRAKRRIAEVWGDGGNNGPYIAAVSPDRLLALLDEVERLYQALDADRFEKDRIAQEISDNEVSHD